MRYYCEQAGSGIPVYRGARFMHGHGFLGRMASRVAIPLFKFLGKSLATTGLDIASDVIAGRQGFKQAVKSNFRSNRQKMADDIIPLLKNGVSTGSLNFLNDYDMLNELEQQQIKDQKGKTQAGSGRRKPPAQKRKPPVKKKQRAKKKKVAKRAKTTHAVGPSRKKMSLDGDISARTLKKYPFFQL